MTRSEIIAETKSALISVSVTGVMAYLTAQFPFFGLPVVFTITKAIVTNIITIAVEGTALGAYDIYVDHYTESEAIAFKKSVEFRKIATADQKILADKAVVDAARKFIRLSSA